MKQNTRIARLVHNKRVKKVTSIVTVGLLVCPLAIGTAQVLADNIEEPAVTEEVASVENTEPIAVEPVEEAPVVEETQEPTVDEAQPDENITTSSPELSQEPAVEAPLAVAELTIITGTADEVGLNTAGIRAAMASVDNARANESKYTPESFAAFNTAVEAYYSNGVVITTATDYTNEHLEDDQYWIDANTTRINAALGLLVLVPEVPEEKVNVIVNYTDENDVVINTETVEAVKDSSYTASAPQEFSTNGSRYWRTSAADGTVIATEGAVINFKYTKIVATMNDVFVEGPTTAVVGETVTYSMKSVTSFNYGDDKVEYLNFEAGNPVTVTPNNATISAGDVTFTKAGTYQVAGGPVTESLTVNVTKNSQEKTLTGIGFIPVIGMGVDGKLVPWSDFRVNLYYSDNTEEAVIPNATDYVFTTDNPNDVITADGIIFNGVGSRVITVTHKGFTDKNGFVVVADQGLKEDDLKEAIKNGEDKISQGGWQTTKDLENAISKGKEILADDNRTQTDIDNATKNINDAINALDKIDNNGGNDNEDNNGANNGGNQDNDNTNNGANSNTGNNSSNKTNTTNVNNKSNQASNNSNKDNLPQTGDSTTNGLLAGLSMVGLSAIAWIKRKRKA